MRIEVRSRQRIVALVQGSEKRHLPIDCRSLPQSVNCHSGPISTSGPGLSLHCLICHDWPAKRSRPGGRQRRALRVPRPRLLAGRRGRRDETRAVSLPAASDRTASAHFSTRPPNQTARRCECRESAVRTFGRPRALERAPANALAHSSICAPISITRSGGMLKNLVAGKALRDMKENKPTRQRAMPGRLVTTKFSRPRKKVVCSTV